MIGRANIIFGIVCIALAVALESAAFAIGHPWSGVMNIVTFTVGVTQILMGLDANREQRQL